MSPELTFDEQLQAFAGVETSPPVPAPDAVNAPMIRHWCEAMGDTNPIYLDDAAARAAGHPAVVAPPTMLQAWVMWGMTGRPTNPDDPYERMTQLLLRRGFTSVVATNSEQEYHRYLTVGDRLTMRTTIESISGEKDTALGPGHFVTTRQDYHDQGGELVGTMRFRIIRFRPRHPSRSDKPAAGAGTETGAENGARPAPAITRDNEWWFEALNAGRLLIQACAGCGALRFPTAPVCRHCHSFEWRAVEANGTGSIHSFVVTHHPQAPGFEYPLPIVLVDLDEGVRMVMNTVDTARDAIRIGARVAIDVRATGAGTQLPFARIIAGGGS